MLLRRLFESFRAQGWRRAPGRRIWSAVTAPSPRPQPLRAVAKAVLLGAGVPLAVALILNARRPDLVQWVLSRTTGYWLIAGVVLLCAGATAAFLAAELAPFTGRARPRLLKLAGLLLCLLPALVAILVGPIAIAFMYGAAG